jgi:predicted O-linked N-acetylglucosamine transferase (SPINDLY family)
VADHLALYGEMDVALDPFPYNGTATTMQALRVGVPVLTLQGDRFISRVGASLLANAGLEDWIAADMDDYVALAQRWAADRTGLAALRAELPARMAASPMTDLDGFARDFGDMLTTMWRTWCLSDTSSSSP